MGYNNFLVGSDPEFFIVDNNDQCIPPYILREHYHLPIFGGEVDQNNNIIHAIYKKDQHFILMEDGAAMEVTLPPANNPEDLYNNFYLAVECAKELVHPLGYDTFLKPVVDFNADMFPQYKDTPGFKFANRFGCDKDFDIYGGQWSVEIDASKVFVRTAGAHIHTSPIEHKLGIPYAKLMDMTVGQLFIATTIYPEQEKIRQTYYGRPGKIRYPTYSNDITGIEYRTPSISLFSSLNNIENVFDCISFSVETLQSPDTCKSIIKTYLESAIENILTCNSVSAYKLLETLGLRK